MIINSFEVPGVRVPEPNNRIIKTLMSPELKNCNDHTILVSIIERNSSTGLHIHGSHEYMFVVCGRGEAISYEEDKEFIDKVEPGTLIFAPKDEKHNIRNTGDDNLKLFCVYTPAIKPKGKFKESIDIQLK